MNIEQMTTKGAVTKADLGRSRKVLDGEDGAIIRLQHFEQGEVTCSALFLVPAEGDQVEFICAGRAGNWMREAANEFVAAKQRMAEDGMVSDGGVICSEGVFQAAVDAGFNLVATPMGMMDLVREEESFNLTISCEAWGGEGGSCPAQDDASWMVARVETLDLAEVGFLHILEQMPLDRAVDAAALLKTLTVRDQQIEIEFESVAQMCEVLEVTEAGESLRVEPEPVEDVEPVTMEDHEAAGEDLLELLETGLMEGAEGHEDAGEDLLALLDADLMGEPEPEPEAAPEAEPELEPEFDQQGQAAFRF